MLGAVAAMLVWAAVGVAEASTQLEVGVCPSVTTQPDLDLRQVSPPHSCRRSIKSKGEGLCFIIRSLRINTSLFNNFSL